MTWQNLLYVGIMLIYGEVMYLRGKRDIHMILRRANEQARIMMSSEEDEEDDDC